MLDYEIIQLGMSNNEESKIEFNDLYTQIDNNVNKLNKQYMISINVFQNGQVLTSSINEYCEKQYYDYFTRIINEIKMIT